LSKFIIVKPACPDFVAALEEEVEDEDMEIAREWLKSEREEQSAGM